MYRYDIWFSILRTINCWRIAFTNKRVGIETISCHGFLVRDYGAYGFRSTSVHIILSGKRTREPNILRDLNSVFIFPQRKKKST